jgi:protein tyrosine kinase modulator
MNAAADFNISQILSDLHRRKGLLVSVLVVVSVLTGYLAAILPDIYRSSTLIVVTPQRVPTSFVTSTVTIDLNERMQSIVQEILSRTQLEKIIRQFDLYSSSRKSSIEDRVERLRNTVKIEFRKNNVFQLSFESESPEKAKQVTSELASIFIAQNLHAREQQAEGTKSFINAEVERLRKELEEQESVVNRYKAANLFELPDQLNANLRTLEQFRHELDSNSQRMSALQERKGVLQKQSVESDIVKVDGIVSLLAAPADGVTENVQIGLKRKEMDSLLQKYSSKHPDVVRLQKEIQVLEAESVDAVSSKSANSRKTSNLNPVKEVLQRQIADIDSEIQALRLQAERARSQIGTIQSRVDNAPVRAIELSKISRGYDITLRKYQDLLAKGLESELSENMEKKLKGEQFQILDPANFPLKPVGPNRPLLMLIGLLTGIAGGVGLAFLCLDTSFKRSDEITTCIDVPLLATLPALVTRSSVLEQRRTQGLLVLASIGSLAVGIVCLRILGPMYF